MKYLVFILKALVLFVFQLLMTVVGILILPLFLKRVEEFECTNETSRPSLRFKDKWIDAVFGNIEDGVDGDIYYRRKYEKLSMWTRYNWVAIRNPIHNLALRTGVDEVIKVYTWAGNRYAEDRVGREGWCYSEAVGESGKVYAMFRWCKLWHKNYGVECNIGYKNFNINDVGVPYKYSFTVSFNPIKKFEKQHDY